MPGRGLGLGLSVGVLWEESAVGTRVLDSLFGTMPRTVPHGVMYNIMKVLTGDAVVLFDWHHEYIWCAWSCTACVLPCSKFVGDVNVKRLQPTASATEGGAVGTG